MRLRDILIALSRFPRRHLFAAGTCAAVLTGVSIGGTESPNAARQTIALALPTTTTETVLVEGEAEQPPAKPTLHTVKVGKGDTLSDLFAREDLKTADMYKLLNSGKLGKKLSQLKPGEEFSYALLDGHIESWHRHVSKLETVNFKKTDSGYESTTEIKTPERRTAFKAAILNDNLFNASDKAGLPTKVTMEMAGIFGGVMDFVYDPRKGDTFSVLYEELYLDGEYLGAGDVIAANYINRGEVHEAYRYIDTDGDTSYYNAQGISMRKAFLRAPVDFRRISSNFNPNRLHPILKTRRPHRGIDYAASRGTPVFAAGDGRVITSGYNKASGNYVVIQHGPRYQTKYLHLNRRNVKKGQKIRQGQVLGTVGSTGYATGPHLHYEFLLDGVHRNPRTILKKLPKAQSIAKTEKAEFLKHIAPVQTQFSAYKKTVPFLLASAPSQAPAKS